ncbi:hypothetical protein TrCOL_g3667 [Triparma columacea]|uniref:Histone-lysine N-methyltransferase, H3 lysine-79 specific n=1 Tax=Triparma columacea TaxID=722753 RepID=A0A9W7GME2_9STRA|nr:hypothetical protein TrCOL_g3667 [Triparma columacea]
MSHAWFLLSSLLVLTRPSSGFIAFARLRPHESTLFSAYDTVDTIFNPDDVETRNAASRTSGYWRYVQKGKEPPLEFTYGEFPISSFERVIKSAITHHPSPSPTTFFDLGSGAGRLVVAASLLFPSLTSCTGVEILPSLHEFASSILSSNPNPSVSLICGSWTDPYLYLGDADIIFCYSSCLPPEHRYDLKASLLRQLKPGTVVVTTEYSLSGTVNGYEMEEVESFDVDNDLVGGISTVYIQRVVTSGWFEGMKEKIDAERPSSDALAAMKVVREIEDEEECSNSAFIFKTMWENNCKMLNVPPRIWNESD